MEPESQNMVHHEPLRASNLISRQLGDDLLEEERKIILGRNGTVLTMRKISGDNTPDKNILRQPMNQESPQTPDTFGKNTSENSGSKREFTTPQRYNIKETLNQVFPNISKKRPEPVHPRNNLPPLRKNGNLFVPPPDFFRNKRVPKTPKTRPDLEKIAQRSTTGNKKFRGIVQAELETKSESNVELNDFTTLLTKRLVENLDENDVSKGNYVVKKKSYCLVIQAERTVENKAEPLSYKDQGQRFKNFEDVLPGPLCLGLVMPEKRKAQFRRKDIMRFERKYKDQLYDTFIKMGEYYQAFIPPKIDNKNTAFMKHEVIFGVAPQKPIDSLEESEKSTSDGDGVNYHRGSPFKTDHELIEEKIIHNGSYVMDDAKPPAEIVETMYIKRRAADEYLIWDPVIVKNEEVQDLIGQVLEEFGRTPITKSKIYDYLIELGLDINTFLDHLEEDHPDFQQYIANILQNN